MRGNRRWAACLQRGVRRRIQPRHDGLDPGESLVGSAILPHLTFGGFMLLRSVLAVSIGAGAGALAESAWSQGFPEKPVHIVVAAAGTFTDVGARIISPGLTSRLGRPVVVDNRPG